VVIRSYHPVFAWCARSLAALVVLTIVASANFAQSAPPSPDKTTAGQDESHPDAREPTVTIVLVGELIGKTVSEAFTFPKSRSPTIDAKPVRIVFAVEGKTIEVIGNEGKTSVVKLVIRQTGDTEASATAVEDDGRDFARLRAERPDLAERYAKELRFVQAYFVFRDLPGFTVIRSDAPPK